MSAEQRRVLLTACASHGLIHVYELSVPALLVLIQAEFAAGDFRMGQVVALYGLLFGLGALPAGYFADRFGSKLLLLVCLWGGALSMLGMAASPGLGAFTGAAAAMGLSISVYHPAGTALITHALPHSGRVFAWHGMAGNLGVAGASVLAGSLGALFGWRWAVGLLGAVGLVIGALALRLDAPPPHEIRRRPGRASWGRFALLLFAMGFMGMVYRGSTTFLPKFFAMRSGQEPAGATAAGGALTTAALLVGLVGMYVAGRTADAGLRPARVFLIGAVFQVPFLVAIGWLGGVALLPLAMGFAFFHFFTQPPGNQMVAGLTPPRLRGLAYGIYFFLSFGVGSVGAAVGGWASERFGMAATFTVLAALLAPTLLAIAVLSLLPRHEVES